MMRPRDPKYWSQSFWDLLKNLLRRKQFGAIAEAASYRAALESIQKTLLEIHGPGLSAFPLLSQKLFSDAMNATTVALNNAGDAAAALSELITELRDLVDEKKVDVAAAMINELDKTEDDRFKLESISRRFGLRAR